MRKAILTLTMITVLCGIVAAEQFMTAPTVVPDKITGTWNWTNLNGTKSDTSAVILVAGFDLLILYCEGSDSSTAGTTDSSAIVYYLRDMPTPTDTTSHSGISPWFSPDSTAGDSIQGSKSYIGQMYNLGYPELDTIHVMLIKNIQGHTYIRLIKGGVTNNHETFTKERYQLIRYER